MAIKNNYRQKPDPITNQIDRQQRDRHNRMHFALAPLDRRMAEAEARWGYDRLVKLVPPDLAEKFGSAKAKLDDAIEADDPEAVAKKAAVLIRGIDALERWCEENDVSPEPEQPVIATAADGRRIGIARDIGEATLLRRDGGFDFEVYSLEEVANIVLSHQTALVSTVKDAFPGAKVTAVKADADRQQDDFDFKRGDTIPF